MKALSVRRGPGLLVFPAVLLTACGQFKYPEATTPPEWAVVGERAPAFALLAEDPSLPGKLDEARSESFKGHVLVAMGAERGFVGELVPWLAVLEEHYGPPRKLDPSWVPEPSGPGRYCVLLIVERVDPGTVRELESVMPQGLTMLADPEGAFANAEEADGNRFGFVGEGPHVTVIAVDGTLVALIDGPVSERRRAKLVKAMDGALPPLDGH